MSPLVSVIVPNYNYGRTLPLCLSAIQAQTHAPLEILYVDDGSTDDSVLLAHSFGVRVLRTPCNSGVSAARNLGAAHASGEILVFVDSDVAPRPDAIANAVALLSADPDLGAVTGNYDPEPLIDDGPVEHYRNFHQHYWLEAAEGPITGYVPTAILAMRAEVFAEVGPFNPALRETEGADYGSRLGRRHRILLTSAVRGRHDNDASLRLVLRKVFKRTRLHVPHFLRRDVAGSAATSSQSGSCLTACLTAASVPLPVLFGPLWALAPALLLTMWVAADARMYRAAVRYRGLSFGLFFVAMHYLVNLTTAAGLAAGAGQWLTSRSFRHLYDPDPLGPAPTCRIRRWAVRLLSALIVAWLLLAVLNLLLSGRFWLWILPYLLPPAAFLAIPLVLTALTPLVRPRWWITAGALAGLLAGGSQAGINLAALGPGPGPVPAGSLRVVTWSTGIVDGISRPDRIFQYLQSLHADVYLLGEYLPSAAGPAVLRHYFPGYTAVADGDLLTLSRLPVVAIKMLPAAPPAGSTFDQQFAVVKAIRTDVRADGRILSLYNVHMPVQIDVSSPLRAKFYRLLRTRAAQRRDDFGALDRDVAANKLPVLVAGDFNTSPAMGDMRGIAGMLRDAITVNRSLFPASWDSQFPLALVRLDWAFTSPGVNVSRYDFLDAQAISDHRAQSLMISLGKPS
jgi:GT2 family glycosyltransferase/endonuclease/exonuclease/phosphatase family metal-dependent hydrolase